MMADGLSKACTCGVRRRPVGEGLFVGSLDRPEELCLAGTRCLSCGVTSFGTRSLCPNCGGSDTRHFGLARQGTIKTFSVLRHRPPGNYRGQDPFEPFAVGLVSLPDGVAVVSPLAMAITDVRIGKSVSLAPHVLHCDQDGTEVIAFRFVPSFPEEK